MAKGIGGTGEGFDAASKGRLGARGFGGHNISQTALRDAMVKVRLCSPLQTLLCLHGKPATAAFPILTWLDLDL